MKKFVIAICIACFLSSISLVQATEIVKMPLSQEARNNFILQEDKLLMSVDPEEIRAGGVGKVFAAIGIGLGTGLIIYALLSAASNTDENN